MTLEDSIKTSFSEFPHLFCMGNFEDSRIKVLDHYFLCIGNGMDWAYTEKPENGGYLTYLRYNQKNNKQLFNPNYGEEKYKGVEIDRFFQEIFIEINPLLSGKLWEDFYYGDYTKPAIFRGFLSDCPKGILKKSVPNGVFRVHTKTSERGLKDIQLYEGYDINLKDPEYGICIQSGTPWDNLGPYKFKPYPFSATLWPLAEIDVKFIQPDWKQGMIDVKEKAFEYYNNSTYEDQVESSNGHNAGVYSPVLYKYSEEGKNLKDLLSDYGITVEFLGELSKLKLEKGKWEDPCIRPKSSNSIWEPLKKDVDSDLYFWSNLFAEARFLQVRSDQLRDLSEALDLLKG